MAANHFGKRPPRYLFALNSYTDTRFSRCPKCDRPTYKRKFPLLIHVDEYGPFALGKTCRYCSKCELIIAHQDELESVITEMFSELAPEVVGNDYFVIGTVERKVWKRGLEEQTTFEEVCEHMADFKNYVQVEYEPPRWVRDESSGK